MEEMGFALAVQIELLRAAESSRQSEPDAEHEPLTIGGTPAPQPSPTSAAPTAPTPLDPQGRDVASASSVRVPWSVSIGGGPAIDLNLAPAPTASARLFVGLRYGRVSVELGAGASLPTTDQRPDGTGFHEYMLASELGLCGQADRFGLCALGALGLVSVAGFGVDQPATPTGVLARAGLRAKVTQPLSARLSASLRADALVLLTPWTVYLNQTPVWTMPVFGSAIGLDLSARFP
jgi:hypothetical protein